MVPEANAEKQRSSHQAELAKCEAAIEALVNRCDGIVTMDSDQRRACKDAMREAFAEERRELIALREQLGEARARLLTAAGDDLCRLSQEEIKAYTSGEVPIPPKEEFLPSCERFWEQTAARAGVNHNCLTLAQLVAENEKLRAERDALALIRRISDSEMVALLKRVNQEFLAAKDEAQEVLRELACYVGAGGYNADEVDAKVFEAKIRDGIDATIRPLRERAAQLEQQLAERAGVDVESFVRNLIAVNAMHRDGTTMGDTDWHVIVDHLESEVAELYEAICDRNIDRENVLEELGDIYGIVVHATLKAGFTMADVERREIAKLKERFTIPGIDATGRA